jgi:hypothetical protein
MASFHGSDYIYNFTSPVWFLAHIVHQRGIFYLESYITLPLDFIYAIP